MYHFPLVYIASAIGALWVLRNAMRATRRRMKTTALHGPPSASFLWGAGKILVMSPDTGEAYEEWAEEYGGVYEIPSALGGRRIVLCDPKAVAHMFGYEPWTYVLTPFGRIATEFLAGKGLLTATSEAHSRLRKALTPGFTHAAIRELTSVFYDMAYKVKSGLDLLVESSDGGITIVQVQNWMNHFALDAVGLAGLSHDFGSLDGKKTSVMEVFEAFGSKGGKGINMFNMMLAQEFPWLLRLPTPHSKIVKKLNDTMGHISRELLKKSKKEKEAGTLGEREEKSVLGLLIKNDVIGGGLSLTLDELTAQAKVLLLAGYETTSIGLTWALIELCKQLHIQSKLRAELLKFGADPTYDQLPNNLPYLDAVVHEVLRMHPPLPNFTRMATADDVIPLSKPVQTRSGKLVDHISVAKGTYVALSLPSINCSTALWGPDAKEFRPERWLEEDGIPAAAKEIQGHRHILTFIDGPRICLGKWFALAEFKVLLCVLIKHFVFELVDGPDTAIETTWGILPRPRVVGEEGINVPMRVRRFE